VPTTLFNKRREASRPRSGVLPGRWEYGDDEDDGVTRSRFVVVEDIVSPWMSSPQGCLEEKKPGGQDRAQIIFVVMGTAKMQRAP
jgi:hypothetical protein